jgi:hypothetical protein
MKDKAKMKTKAKTIIPSNKESKLSIVWWNPLCALCFKELCLEFHKQTFLKEPNIPCIKYLQFVCSGFGALAPLGALHQPGLSPAHCIQLLSKLLHLPG